jgi:signal transduction histidine kinase
MNKIKGSYLMKTLVHAALFLSGIILIVGVFHMLNYLNTYSANTTSFLETSEFQSKYLKYVERVAVYVDYREKGYTGSVGYDSSSVDLNSLFERETATRESSGVTLQQQDFDYYNSILNGSNTNFLYYVKNLKTGDIYCSPSLEKTLVNLDTDDDPLETMEEYIKSVRTNPAYLVINTKTRKYVTNVNRDYQYLNDENLRWVIDYTNGNLEENAMNRGEYVICTSIAKGFPNNKDEFGILYQHYSNLSNNYNKYLILSPIAFLLFIFLLGVAIVFSGYKKGVSGISINAFDRLHTEIGFTLVVIGLGILTLLFYLFKDLLFYEFQLEPQYLLIIAYTLLYPYSMFGFLSLIRRFKGNVFLTNSLTYKGFRLLGSFIRDFFEQRNLTFRVAVILFIFAFFQILGLYAFYTDHNYVFLIINIFDYGFLGLVFLKAAIDYNIIRDETKKITEGNLTHKIPVNDMCAPAHTLGDYINNIGDGLSAAVDEKLKSERLKTELIANVSHDIKTPLTSIINYVDLLKKENLENEKAEGYLEILSAKSWRLKTLIEDLVEASKASSGAISLHLECLNLVELVRQSIGEFEDRFIVRQLETVLNISEEPVYIMADGRSTYRIIENIFSNVNKYALSGTRIYVDIYADREMVTVSVKNISANKLNINADELMERFVRGDLSRNTEGSGLGLSIAKSLAALQGATFDILLDGDLFKALVRFPRLKQSFKENSPLLNPVEEEVANGEDLL